MENVFFFSLAVSERKVQHQIILSPQTQQTCQSLGIHLSENLGQTWLELNSLCSGEMNLNGKLSARFLFFEINLISPLESLLFNFSKKTVWGRGKMKVENFMNFSGNTCSKMFGSFWKRNFFSSQKKNLSSIKVLWWKDAYFRSLFHILVMI